MDRHAPRARREHGELVRRVAATDVECRIGFGIAQPLRLLERRCEARAMFGHRGEDVVRRPVDDAEHLLDAIRDEALADRTHDRNAAADAALERDRDAGLPRRVEELLAVLGEQRLVRGDDVLAAPDGLEDHRARRVDAADELDDDVDRRIVQHHVGVVGEDSLFELHASRLLLVLHRDAFDDERHAEALAHLIGVAREHVEDAAPDRAHPQHSDHDRSAAH